MLHLITFPASDKAAIGQLESVLAEGDALVFCEAGRDWPADHPLLEKYPHLVLTPGASDPRLARWLEEQPQSLYWRPSPATRS